MVVCPTVASRNPLVRSARHRISTPRETDIPRNTIWETQTPRFGPCGKFCLVLPGGMSLPEAIRHRDTYA